MKSWKQQESLNILYIVEFMFDRKHHWSCDEKKLWDRDDCGVVTAIDVVTAVSACVPNLCKLQKYQNN